MRWKDCLELLTEGRLGKQDMQKGACEKRKVAMDIGSHKRL